MVERYTAEEHIAVVEDGRDLDPKPGNLWKEDMEQMPCGVQARNYHVGDSLDMLIVGVYHGNSCFAVAAVEVDCTIVGVVVVGIGGVVAAEFVADEEVVVELADGGVPQIVVVQSVVVELRIENWHLE